jgi:hypothetical protein
MTTAGWLAFVSTLFVISFIANIVLKIGIRNRNFRIGKMLEIFWVACAKPADLAPDTCYELVGSWILRKGLRLSRIRKLLDPKSEYVLVVHDEYLRLPVIENFAASAFACFIYIEWKILIKPHEIVTNWDFTAQECYCEFSDKRKRMPRITGKVKFDQDTITVYLTTIEPGTHVMLTDLEVDEIDSDSIQEEVSRSYTYQEIDRFYFEVSNKNVA